MCKQLSHPCTIDCDSLGQENACEDAQIDAERASNLTLHCTDSQSCLNSQIYCPSRGVCSIICGNSGSLGKTCYGMELHCGNGPCYIECQPGKRNDICDNVKVHLSPSTASFQCLNSQCAAIDKQITPFSLTTGAPTLPTVPPTLRPTTVPTSTPTRFPSTLPTLPTSPPTVYESTRTPTTAPTATVVLIGDLNPNPNSNPSETETPSEDKVSSESDGLLAELTGKWLIVTITGGVTMLCLAMVFMKCCCEWKRKRRNARRGKRAKAREGGRQRSDAQGEVKYILPVPEKCPNRVSDAAVHGVSGAVARRSPRPLPPTPVPVPVRGGGDEAAEGGGGFLDDDYMDNPALPASVTRTARMLSSASRQSGYTAVGDEIRDLDEDDAGSDLDV